VAQQENAPNKPVHLMFLCGGLLLFFLLQWSIDWVWGTFAPAPNELVLSVASGVIALVAGIWLFRNDRVHGLANEVTAELRKVTWPTAKEVRAATIVVISMALIAAVILGTFDFVWSQLTELVYG
jgi:preprotein translocase subunit SecE